MFKKLFLLGFFMPFVLKTVVAQTATHSLGSTVPIGFSTGTFPGGGKNTDSYAMALFAYGFRKNLSESDVSSFSIGTITSIGGGLYEDGFGGGFLYSADLQLWGDFNKGIGAVPNPPKNSGFYIGLGVGISYTGADGESIDNDNGLSYGPMVRAGYRFGLYSQKKDVYKAFGIGLYYKHGVENAKWRAIGVHVMVDL